MQATATEAPHGKHADKPLFSAHFQWSRHATLIATTWPRDPSRACDRL